MDLIRTQIMVSELLPGMTVEYKQELYTVNKNDLQFCPFMGHSFRGDASGKYITRIQFAVQTANGIVLR